MVQKASSSRSGKVHATDMHAVRSDFVLIGRENGAGFIVKLHIMLAKQAQRSCKWLRVHVRFTKL